MNTNKILLFAKDNILTIIALVFSLFTLMVYVRQTNQLTRQTDILIEQNRTSTWPYLYIGRGISMDDSTINKYNILIVNQGNGPAIIEKAALRLDGIELESWFDLYRQVQVPESIVVFQKNAPLRHRVIMPGETLDLIEWVDNPPLIQYIYPMFDNLELEICYRSVLGDHWTVKRSSFGEEKYFDDDIISYQEGCLIKAEKYFRE